MKWIFRLFVLVLLLAGWGLAALSLHVVLAPGSPGRLAVIPKDRLGVTDTWVDLRNWTAADLPNHPAVVARLVQTGKADFLTHVADEKSLKQQLPDLVAAGANKKPASAGQDQFPLRD